MRFSDVIKKPLITVSLVSLVGLMPATGVAKDDAGQKLEEAAAKAASKAVGVKKALAPGECVDVPSNYRTPVQLASDQIALAKGLEAEYVTRVAGNNTDMMVLWPDDESPTHLLTAVEGSRTDLGGGKFNPSVQRISLATGVVETILRGLTSVDPIRKTPWGTVLVGEETTGGGAYEIINPLTTTNVTVTDRATGALSGTDAANVAKRPALPAIAWEGNVILENGIMYLGDELRPGTGTANKDGGAIYKFVPTTLWAGGAPITDLVNSPFAAGAVYAARVSCTSGVQYGQGCEVGNLEWVPVTAATARDDANTAGATGYYRPEDMERDPSYDGDGLRACWTNTQSADAKGYGEVMCVVDTQPTVVTAGVTANARIFRFWEGNVEANQPDNLAYQLNSNAMFVIEDNPNGEVYACLPDGDDLDEKTDGCALVACVKDDSAEPTGWLFSTPNAKGEMDVYVTIQHTDDGNMPLVDDYRTDDVLKITGFKVKAPKN